MSEIDPAIRPASTAACPRCGAAARPGARFCRTCGTNLVDPAPDGDLAPEPVVPASAPVPAPLPEVSTTAAADSAPSSPWMRRLLRRRLLLGGVVALVLVVVVSVVAVIQSTFYAPDRPVRAFFAAMQERDGARLAELSHCESSPLCTAGGLTSGYQAPEQLEIVGVEYGAALPDDQTRRPDRSHAVVTVRYQLAGAVHEDRVSLDRADFGLFRDWSINTPPGAWLDVVSPYAATAQLAGATVSTVKQAGTGTNTKGAVWALPGVYTLTAVPDPLYDVQPGSVTVTGADRQAAEPTVSLKVNILEEVDHQVRARVDECARQADMRPTVDTGSPAGGGCPFQHSSKFTFIRNVRWTVDRYPDLEIRLADSGPQVHTTKPGQATITYEWTRGVLEPRDWTTESAASEITVSGPVELVDGKPLWRG